MSIKNRLSRLQQQVDKRAKQSTQEQPQTDPLLAKFSTMEIKECLRLHKIDPAQAKIYFDSVKAQIKAEGRPDFKTAEGYWHNGRRVTVAELPKEPRPKRGKYYLDGVLRE